MAKTIWILNQYASTPQTGMGGRHYYLAKEMARQGHNVYLIAASYTHLLRNQSKISSKFKLEEAEGFHFVWVNMPKYAGAHDKKRVLNWFLFAWKSLSLPSVIKDTPDIILASSPSLLTSLAAKQLAKKFKAKLAFEVRDIWPLTLIEMTVYSAKHPFIRFLQWVEDNAYKDADVVISNLPGAVEHMVERGMDRKKFYWIPNGFDLKEVSHPESLPKNTLLLLPKDKFIIGYTGTLGLANSLSYFIKAAKLLKNDTSIMFVIVGDGKEKINLVAQAQELKNIVFINPIPKQQIQSMLSMFDVCYIGWKSSSLYRFGISPNKLFEYMRSGKPVLHSYSGFHDFIDINNAGISVHAEDSKAIADAILKLKNMTQKQRDRLGENGYKYAVENHSYSYLAARLLKAFGVVVLE